MSLEEFLQLAKKRKEEIEIRNKDRKCYSEGVFNEIVSLAKDSYANVPDSFYEGKILFEKIKLQLNITYDLIVPFLRHYAKTDKISFTYTSEEKWKSVMNSKEFESNPFFKSIHLLLKKTIVNKHTAIVDLPSRGFLELDYLLFIYSKEIVDILNQEKKFV